MKTPPRCDLSGVPGGRQCAQPSAHTGGIGTSGHTQSGALDKLQTLEPLHMPHTDGSDVG